MKPHERLTPENQVVIGNKLRAEYEAGASIREISYQTGYSITRVRTLLSGVGVEFREAGKH